MFGYVCGSVYLDFQIGSSNLFNKVQKYFSNFLNIFQTSFLKSHICFSTNRTKNSSYVIAGLMKILFSFFQQYLCTLKLNDIKKYKNKFRDSIGSTLLNFL